MTIVVFGAYGFIGKHLVRRLSDLGMDCRAVGRHNQVSELRSIGVEGLPCDFRDSMSTLAALQGASTVIQLISTSTPGLRNAFAVDDIFENVVPHVRFLQQCIEAGVRRYIFISSGGTVYGPGAPSPTPEDASTSPICSHGITKLTIEKYLQMYGHVNDLEHFILRLANPYGPGQLFRKGQGLIPAILDRQDKNLPVAVYGTGSARRDYIYIDDVIDAIVLAAKFEGSPRHILNIGTGESHSVAEVIATIETATGHPVQFRREAERATDVSVSRLDVSKAHQVLDWQPKTSFVSGIRRTVAAWRGDYPKTS